ncbi:SIS domain-containing protein [Sphingomonas qilianensis]|uniref:KpsF/GutQ family sugar-phosphate isomerase n=1 Tax=Sphingomonas qilianensis TaxID=1736690 RepID=A0ABU9XRC0_9SPHN
MIRCEAAALTLLADQLDGAFDLAVQHILTTSGRVIVSGMGKAGHVGRKIAATLSATGSPAFFIHPSEAAHGDLGMLKNNDTVLALSNSGSTPEVLLVVRHMLAAGVPVIAITGNGASPLAKIADVALVLPAVAEACPEGIAPTTSSTMKLALGDALAIATMRARGFSRAELARLHPGGSIGWRTQPVARLIRHDFPLPLATCGTSLHDVILKMTEAGKGVAGIVDDAGLLLGVITDGDLRRGFASILSSSADQVMTRNPKTVTTNTTIGDAAALMAEARINVVFVTDPKVEGRPVGVIHLHDLAMIG